MENKNLQEQSKHNSRIVWIWIEIDTSSNYFCNMKPFKDVKWASILKI